MKLLQRVFRSLLDRELGVLGDEVSAIEAQLTDLGERIDSLKMRLDRLWNRENMRTARSARRVEQDPEAAIAAIRAAHPDAPAVRDAMTKAGAEWEF